MTPWTCATCSAENTHDTHCQTCERARFKWFEEQFCAHILEHIADGISDPMTMFLALKARPCYARWGGDMPMVARYMRLVTKDTTQIARDLLKARAAQMALRASDDTAKHETLVQLLKGIQVLGEVQEHKHEIATVIKHVYEDEPKKV